MCFESRFSKSIRLLVVIGLTMTVAFACAAPAKESTSAPSPAATATKPVVAAPTEIAKATPAPTKASTPSADDKPVYGGVFRSVFDYTTDPPHFDPHVASPAAAAHAALSLVNLRLLRYPIGAKAYPGDCSVEPELAESWDMPNDTTYVFHLHKGIKWENKPPVNGRELTAEDVKYTYERIDASRPTKVYIIDAIKSIDVIDKYTVQFTTKTPYAPFLTGVADADTEIVAKDVVDKFGDLKSAEAVIGHGPFILKEHRRGTGFFYVKNPDYFVKGQPYLDELRILILPDSSTRVASLRSGQVDVLRGIEADMTKSLKQTNPELVLTEYLKAGGRLIFRNDQPPFNDKRLRQAVSMAIDRQAWVDSLYMGRGEIVYGTILPESREWAMPKSDFGPAAKYFEYNIPEAKRLLAEAGYPNGLKTEMHFTAGYGQYMVEWLELLKDMLSRAGIDMEIKLKEYGAFIATTYAGDYQGLSFGSISTYPDPDRILYQANFPGQRMNNAHVNDPVLNEMIQKEQQTVDKVKRKAVIDDLQRYHAEQMYYLFVPSPYVSVACQPWVHNYGMRLDYARERAFGVTWMTKR